MQNVQISMQNKTSMQRVDLYDYTMNNSLEEKIQLAFKNDLTTKLMFSKSNIQ